jgi:hypothetical protein
MNSRFGDVYKRVDGLLVNTDTRRPNAALVAAFLMRSNG